MKTLLTVLTLLVLSTLCNAQQQWPRFLGERDPSAFAVTPRHHVCVYTGGFEFPRRKQVEKKLPARMRAQGVPEPTITQAQDYARRLTGQGQASILLDEIDAAVDRLTATWAACGGSHATFARSFDWSQITVTIADTVISTPSGLSYGVTWDRTHIEVVNLSFGQWFSDPTHAYLITLTNIVAWEAGNAMSWQYQGYPTDNGSFSPCTVP